MLSAATSAHLWERGDANSDGELSPAEFAEWGDKYPGSGWRGAEVGQEVGVAFQSKV